jgi:hypothetical protein
MCRDITNKDKSFDEREWRRIGWHVAGWFRQLLSMKDESEC